MQTKRIDDFQEWLETAVETHNLRLADIKDSKDEYWFKIGTETVAYWFRVAKFGFVCWE